MAGTGLLVLSQHGAHLEGELGELPRGDVGAERGEGNSSEVSNWRAGWSRSDMENTERETRVEGK